MFDHTAVIGSDATAKAYDRLSGTYNERFGREARATWEAGILQLAAMAELEGKRVLDLGAGTGVGGRLLRASGPSRLVALDRSVAMLRLARGVYDASVIGDLARAPFGQDSFDTWVCGYDTINHVPLAHLKQVMGSENLLRVSKRAAFDCFTRESESALLESCWTQGLTLCRLRPGLLASTHELHGQALGLLHFLSNRVELEICLRAAGWRIAELQPVRLPHQDEIPGHLALGLERVE